MGYVAGEWEGCIMCSRTNASHPWKGGELGYRFDPPLGLCTARAWGTDSMVHDGGIQKDWSDVVKSWML